jgi:hypothetical protein
MATIKDPIGLARQAAMGYATCYGDQLVSVIVYGSAAGEEFNPRSSDINLLVVLKTMTPAMLEKSRAIQDNWIKKRFGRPLFLDPDYIAGSLDSFPIEFLNMQQSHVVVHGEDVLAPLAIDARDLRLQIERELRGKWLHLLKGWLDTSKNDKLLAAFIGRSLKDFTVIFRAMLYLKKVAVPPSRLLLCSTVAKLYGLDEHAFDRVLEAPATGSGKSISSVFPLYSQAIDGLIKNIDQLTIKESV